MNGRTIRLLLLPVILAAQDAPYDLIVSGGHVVDGAANPWFRADIAIRGDRIAAMGDLKNATARQRIDAQGLTVAPGFIDVHSHGRRGIFLVPTAENYLREGVTTIIEGPDGSSPLPLPPFFSKLQQTGISINVGSFVGHGTIREQVVGLVNRDATAPELDRMRSLAEQAMKDGAFGLSTGLFYVPGNFAKTAEVIELAKVVGALGGIHQSHMRDEGDHIEDSVRETIRIGEEGHLPTQITHHKVIGKANWGQSAATLRLVEEARARGVDVTVDQYPYTASSTGLAALLPQWALEGGQKATVERLQAPDARARIKQQIVANLRDGRGGGDAGNVTVANCAFDGKLAGKSLAVITRESGKEPTFDNAAETAMDMQRRGGCSMIYHAIAEEDVARIMKAPYTMIASDGDIPVFGQASPHPRSYGTFARVLGVYVRQQHILTLEDAVHKMTGLPAQRLGISDRGLLRVGMKADLVVFDPSSVSDRSTFEKPHQYSAGFEDVLVNGRPVLLHGVVTAARPGQVLYGPAKRELPPPGTANR